jgi:TRAP-type mannitol/chloroaromatic compound transport system permease small subunit
MPGYIVAYVHWIDRINRSIGRATMYLIFVMIAVLFYSSLNKAFFTPTLWTLDVAQFLMMAYFFLGGPYSLQEDGHVRMDLLYATWSPTTRAMVDSVTILFLLAYLGILLFGSVESLIYSIEYGERSFSAWRPYMWPIKAIMTLGATLMLLQVISQLFKDIAVAKGTPIT